MRYDGPVVIILDKQTKLKDVEETLKAANVRLKWAVTGPMYAVDDHFSRYVLTTINTLQDALEFADKLDADRKSWEKEFCHLPGQCTKAQLIRNWLRDSFWKESADRLRTAIACQRRVHCGCHETGSFAKSNR